ncbi:MAG: radical SAM protein [Magnetococcus sp. DMHC-1]
MNIMRKLLKSFLSTHFPEFLDFLRRFSNYFLWQKVNQSLYFRPPIQESELQRWESLPTQQLDIEFTNICNANCVFCGYQYQQRPHATMTNELFAKALHQFKALGGTQLVISPLVGESLIDGQCLEKLELAGKMGFDSILFITNGILLERTDVSRLLKSGITGISISMSGFDANEYERIYRNRSYPKLLRGIQKLFKTNEQLNYPVNIIVNVRSDTLDYINLKRPDFVNLIQPYLREADAKNGTKCVRVGFAPFFDSWGKMIQQKDLPPGMRLGKIYPNKKIPCYGTFNLKLLHDGKVEVCGCRFSHLGPPDELLMGNLHETTLQEIWSSERLKNFRRRFGTGNIPYICKTCHYYFPADQYSPVFRKIK